MICPKCNQMVDPAATNEWLELLLSKPADQWTDRDVLKAVLLWDESVMWNARQSVLPTELRDAVRKRARA